MRRKIEILAETLALTAAPLISQASAQTVGASDKITRVGSEQPADERLARIVTGQVVHNAGGETIGSVNDLVFNRQGQISTVSGVGGLLSICRLRNRAELQGGLVDCADHLSSFRGYRGNALPANSSWLPSFHADGAS